MPSTRDWPIFEPQNSASELAANPHRVDIEGEVADVAYPALCAFCGAGAGRRIAVAKVFRDQGGSDGVAAYRIRSAHVPYCEPCIAEHQREARQLTPAQRLAVSLATGLIVSSVGSAFMALVLLPAALRDLLHPGFPLPLAAVLFFAAIAASSFRGAWAQTAHRRIPPQTRISRAFDFSDSGAALFEKKGFTCAIQNAAFADAWIALNRARVRKRSGEQPGV